MNEFYMTRKFHCRDRDSVSYCCPFEVVLTRAV